MPQVFLLHGLGADHRAFQRFERFLPEAWDIHAIDLLGHGDAPKPEHGYALEDHADYVAEVIAEVDGLATAQEVPAGPPVVVGHSYGAATAVVLAANYPNLVRSLVLLDPVLRLDAPVNQSAGNATGQMMRARREGTLDEVVPRLFAREGSALRSWIIDTWQQMAVGVIDELDGSWPDYAAGVTCPVTIVHGDRELGGSGTSTDGLFPQAKLVRVAGAGHYLHATHVREVAAAVIEAVAATTSHEATT
ncbi:MAG: alpha/beta fold hydrolase [Thermoleophilia bacterium]|nr:alpha/beta fold hydrolase [Thermoleophilia bacterium]